MKIIIKKYLKIFFIKFKTKKYQKKIKSLKKTHKFLFKNVHHLHQILHPNLLLHHLYYYHHQVLEYR